MFGLALFDLDGTLADSKVGILKSMDYDDGLRQRDPRELRKNRGN